MARRRRPSAAVLLAIAANTRALRAELGLTQEQLAEKADLERSYVQKIERGVANMSIETLVALSTALGVRPEALFREAAMPVRKVGRPARRPSTKGT